MMMTEIAKRISKAQDLEVKIDKAMAEGDPKGNAIEMAREHAVTDVLVELLASLKAGETLEEAIESLHLNF